MSTKTKSKRNHKNFNQIKTDPIYIRSKFKLEILSKSVEFEFIYPSDLHWSCIKCGSCCRNPKDRERRILLLPSDISRLKTGGYDPSDHIVQVTGSEPFTAEMKKIEGSCILLSEAGCKGYESRSLLCRMYPFWVEKQGDLFIIRYDDACPGFIKGKKIPEEYFQEFLKTAIIQRGSI